MTVMSATDARPLKASRELIYVLDDDGRVGDIVCRMLEDTYAARAFVDPDLFLKNLGARDADAQPNTIILDLVLRQSDAIEIIRSLHALHYKGKVLLISGRDEQLLLEIQKIGVAHGLAMLPTLRKPFRTDDLMLHMEARPEVMTVAAPRKTGTTQKLRLDQALSSGWLELWYQPKIDLKTISICGVEALVRVRHPKLGIVMPDQFLPSPGDPLYYPLSRFVVRRAVRDWAKYFGGVGRPLKVSVNIPVSVMATEGFVHVLRDCLPRDDNFPGLVIEITEDEAISEPALIREIAHQLRLYDVSLSIDDFGSAYSSLQRLRDLPFAELKLDRSLVSNCAQDLSNRALCESAIALAHRFDAHVCAEGIETPDDLKVLRTLGCDQGQGFLFGKAIPAPDLKKIARMSHQAAMAGDDARRDSEAALGGRPRA